MRRWTTAIVLGVLASVLVALPASADDEDPGRNQVRVQEQVRVQDEECLSDCDPVREQEQTRAEVREGSDDGEPVGDGRPADGDCDGDCVRPEDPSRDRIRDRVRTSAPAEEEIRNTLKQIRQCLARDSAACPDPAVVAQRIRLMLAEEGTDLPGLCLRMWHWWRIAI